MFLRKATTRILKKVAAVALTAVTAFSALSLYPEDAMQEAKAATRTLADGYYYIRNVHSGQYMDVCGDGTTNGTSIIQFPFHTVREHGARNQVFKVVWRGNYYSIHPANCYGETMAFDLLNSAASNTNGTELQIWGHNSSLYWEQKFTIAYAPTGGGFEIGTAASGGTKVLEVQNSSCDPCAVVQIWQRDNHRNNDNWEFEDAYISMAYHVVTNDISDQDIMDAQHITTRFAELGFNAQYYKNTTKEAMANSIKNASVLVIHGHGNAGGIKTDRDGGWIVPRTKLTGYLNSNDKLLSSIMPSYVAQHLDLVFLASCHSADIDYALYGKSMAMAARELGAKCVIGFYNTVAGAEDYLLHMMNYMYVTYNATIQDAMNFADSQYTAEQKRQSSCPANTSNRWHLGNTNIVLDWR